MGLWVPGWGNHNFATRSGLMEAGLRMPALTALVSSSQPLLKHSSRSDGMKCLYSESSPELLRSLVDACRSDFVRMTGSH